MRRGKQQWVPKQINPAEVSPAAASGGADQHVAHRAKQDRRGLRAKLQQERAAVHSGISTSSDTRDTAASIALQAPHEQAVEEDRPEQAWHDESAGKSSSRRHHKRGNQRANVANASAAAAERTQGSADKHATEQSGWDALGEARRAAAPKRNLYQRQGHTLAESSSEISGRSLQHAQVSELVSIEAHLASSSHKASLADVEQGTAECNSHSARPPSNSSCLQTSEQTGMPSMEVRVLDSRADADIMHCSVTENSEKIRTPLTDFSDPASGAEASASTLTEIAEDIPTEGSLSSSPSTEKPPFPSETLVVEPPASWLDSGGVQRLFDLEAEGGMHHNLEEGRASDVDNIELCNLESWEELADVDLPKSTSGTNASECLPWYNRAFLLYCRLLHSKDSGARQCSMQLKTAPRPSELSALLLPRPPLKDLIATVRGISGEGVTLGPEQLTWNLLQVCEPPCWARDSDSASVKWRIHCVDVHKRPRAFHSGFQNCCCLQGSVGAWTKHAMQPGIFEVQLVLQRGQEMHVQIDEDHQHAEIRRLVLTDQLAICVEHRHAEAGMKCLCVEAFAEACSWNRVVACDVHEWESTADYVAGWRAAVELEAACNAVQDGDSRLLLNVVVGFRTPDTGYFDIPTNLVAAHRMKLRGLIMSEDGAAEWGSAWLCLRRPTRSKGPSAWCGHAAVVAAALVGDDDKEESLEPTMIGEEEDWLMRVGGDPLSSDRIRVTFRLNVSSSDPVPEMGAKGMYVIEFMQKSLPYSCMAYALSELASSSVLIKDTVLRGHSRHDSQASASHRHVQHRDPDQDDWHSNTRSAVQDLSDWCLNASQGTAVHAALAEPLALIHGPPGTGKTKTAAALAVLFALQNVRDGASALVLYCTPSNDAADVACLRVHEAADQHFQKVAGIQGLGASNQEECTICLAPGCDIITACKHCFHASCLAQAMAAGTRSCPLCRRALRHPRGGIRALRVYSAELERTDFPVPKRIDHPSARPRKARTVPNYMRPFALHWRCHGMAPGVAPTPEAITAREAYGRLLQAGPNAPDFSMLRMEYFDALAEARAAELRQADTVFATCITSRRGGLAAALHADGAPDIAQVIVDEAGQSPEPETLCPLTLAQKAQRVVLVGDPQQLQPIIKSSKAQSLGLNVSLLERLSGLPHAQPQLLTLQYRMHPDLNAFPSAYFYGGAVRTDASVTGRAPGVLAHPRRPHRPAALLFWVPEVASGAEQFSQVRTAESSAKSRFNPVEASRAADLARALAIQAGPSQVAVLSWYNAQVARVANLLQGTGIHVGSVVTAQGGEWDYVVLSSVRATPGGIGCLADAHLLNVALTRARRGACILGSPAVLRNGAECWQALLEHCERCGAVTTEMPRLLSPPSA